MFDNIQGAGGRFFNISGQLVWPHFTPQDGQSDANYHEGEREKSLANLARQPGGCGHT